jgi:glutamine synthetase
LAADTALRDTLGFDVCERFMDMKWQEWDAYQLSVSDWEWRRYADFF